MTHTIAGRIGKGIAYAIVVILLLLALLPFVLMLVTAIQNTTSLRFEIRPELLTLDNFRSLFTVHDFTGALLNSAIVVTIAVVLNNIVCSLASYAFVFKPFPGSKALFWIYLATMMVPAQVTMIPMFIIFRQLGMLGSYFTLALPVVNAFGVFLIRQFMTAIPSSVIEAARIDGASDMRIFSRIIVPLIKPVLISLTVFTFLTTWNDFLWPLISLQSSDRTTVTLAVSQMKGAFQAQYGMVMAGTTIAFAVPFIVYVILQRQFVQGVTGSAVKG